MIVWLDLSMSIIVTRVLSLRAFAQTKYLLLIGFTHCEVVIIVGNGHKDWDSIPRWSSWYFMLW